MKVAFVSGICGQDGTLLAALLLGKGYQVIGLIPDARASDVTRLEYMKIKGQVKLMPINLLDFNAVKKLFEAFNPSEFYNLAAISSVGFSFSEPMMTFDFNTRSVLNILESIRQVSSGTRFYQASSSEMFGNVGQHRLPIKESFLFHPVSPYGISKASAHWLTINYREAYKLHTCCGILFNHESNLRPPQFVIKKILQSALRIRKGDQIKLELGNISIVRDWGYAPMYVDAMWRMLQQERMDDYLICSGSPISLKEFTEKVFCKLDLNAGDYLHIDSSLLRSLDLEIIYGDNTRARRELGWKYELTPDELIDRLIKDELDMMDWMAARK